jgi:uncharacterized protein
MSGRDAAQFLEDPIDFANRGGRVEGRLDIRSMERLQDLLLDTGGVLSYRLTSRLDSLRRPRLKVAVSGSVALRCDRCLERMDFPVGLESEVLLVAPGMEPADDDDPDSPEWVEAGTELDIKELIEDEVVLGLPMVARHPGEHCGSAKEAAGSRNTAPKPGMRQPFARLGELLTELKKRN